MKIKYNSEMIAGFIFAVVGAVLWFLIPSQVPTKETSAVTAQTFPRIAIGGMLLFSICLLIEGLFMKEKKTAIIDAATFKSDAFKKEIKSVIFALFLIVYCLIVSHLGYVISTLLLIIAVLAFYKAKKWYYYAIPIVILGIVYYVFKTVLHINLPTL